MSTMPIYVVNLIDSISRKENVIKQFDKLSYKPTFFPAIDGRKLTEDELNQSVVATNYLTKGEIGCALSHLSIYKKMIAENINIALIFEDDIVFAENFTDEIIEQLLAFMSSIQENQPAVLLLEDAPFKGKIITKLANNSVSIRKPINGFMAHAYFINLSAAKNILRIQSPIKFEIDAWKFYLYLHQLDLYCVSPSFVIQNPQINSVISEQKKVDFDHVDRRKYKKLNFNQLFKELPVHLKIKTYSHRLYKALRDII